MKLETIQRECKEVVVEADDVTVIVNTWSNLEGASFQMHTGKDMAQRLATALRWEEIDVLIAALVAARAGI